MSYKSYSKAPSRPFDHLYDLNFICNPTRLQRLNERALLQTAPLHIIPCYHLMFSDHKRNFYLPQKNPLPIEPPVDRSKCKRACFLNQNLLSNVPLNYTPNNESIKLSENPQKEKTFRSIKSQTKYRESEVQTGPYLPDAKLAAHQICVPEIACIGIKTIPTLRDIKIIERNRIRKIWEENLLGASMEEKIRQLKIIEWENYLMHEKEMNEMQENRLQQVIEILDERMNATKMINEEIIGKLSQKNALEVKKSKIKFREKLERKLRQMAKFYGQIPDDEVEINVNYNLRPYEPIFQETTTKISMHKNLNFPKSRDGKWREIYEIIHGYKKINKCRKKLKCIEEKEIIQNPPKLSTFDKDDEIEQNSILIQRILKGIIKQTSIVRQVELNRNEILKYRAKFPIKCLQGIIPKITQIPSNIEIKIEPKKDEKVDKIQVKEFVDKKIDEAIEKAKEIHNRKLLQEAERMRKLRREVQEKHKKIAEERQKQSDEIKKKLDELYNEMTSKIIEKITPITIELIAQQDAQKFILKKAQEIDNSTKNSATDAEINEEVEKVFDEVLIPHVMKIIAEKDEEMQALIGSYDAFEDFLKFLCQREKEE